jgi:hypothetical protein
LAFGCASSILLHDRRLAGGGDVVIRFGQERGLDRNSNRV